MTLPATLSLTSLFLITACAGVKGQSRTWTFEQLLQPPTAAEIQRVDQDWARKVWAVGDMMLAGTATIPVGPNRFEARLYTYSLNGSRRCGAVVLPPAAAPKSLAGLVDIGDIRWDYPDRNLTNGAYVAKILAERAGEFALIVPCPRGMALRIGDQRLEASGDRRDAWAGVAEDAMAFLTAALSTTPEVDPERLGAYGYSRGGGVALIMGQRDRRIKAVLDFAGPTDWFGAMGRPGQNWAERLEQACLRSSLPPDTRESQFLDWFVRDRDTLSLADLRRRLVAASPLYFSEQLPPFQIHHGEDDGPVPVRNATALRDRLVTERDSASVFIYRGAGHLLDDTPALATARAFLVERLLQQR